MSRPVPFKVADVTRAVKAAQKAGVSVARVEVDPKTGKIAIVAKGEGDEAGADTWAGVG